MNGEDKKEDYSREEEGARRHNDRGVGGRREREEGRKSIQDKIKAVKVMNRER